MPIPIGPSKSKRIAGNHVLLFDYVKDFDCIDHKKTWKILQNLGLLEHVTCLPRNLYAGQESTVRKGHGMTDWFRVGKGIY